MRCPKSKKGKQTHKIIYNNQYKTKMKNDLPSTPINPIAVRLRANVVA